MTESLSKIIAETLSSGIEPLHRTYLGIYDGYGDVPVAYLTETEVFTSVSGVVADYKKAIDGNEVGKRFSLSCISNAVRTLERLNEKDRQVSFITADVMSSFLRGNVASDIKSVVKDDTDLSKVCLMTDEDILVRGGEKAADGIADLRGMGFSVAVRSFNGEQSLSALMKIPVNYVFLSPEMTALSRSRNKSGLFTALTGLLRSLRIDAVLCGVEDDDAIRDATAAECFGIMPSNGYAGQFKFRKGAAALNEILSDGDKVL